MKNSYCMDALGGRSEVPLSQKSEAFFKMLDFTVGKTPRSTGECIEKLEAFLSGGDYFIAHNIVGHKGRKRFFTAAMYVSEAKYVLAFARSSTAADDLRELIIAPAFVASPSRVLLINEDAVALEYY